MSRRRIGTAGLALLGLLAFPGTGHANFIDWIWSMSGPQMVSFVVLHCELDWEHNAGNLPEAKNNLYAKDADLKRPWTLTECRIYDYRFTGNLRSRTRRMSWLSIDTAAYTSTSKDSGTDFETFRFDGTENYMFAVEPIFEVRSFTTDNWMFNHGVIGASFQVLAGDGYSPIEKFAIKFKPIVVTYKKINGAFNMRWYPNGFTPDQFGLPNHPRLDNVDRPSEMVWGFSVGYLWGPQSTR